MKKLLSVACAAMMAMAIAGCGGGDKKAEKPAAQPNAGVPAHKEKLIIGTDADVNNLNLQKQQDAANNVILKNTHQTLVFFNNGSQGKERFVPGLATDWKFVDDTHIIMNLRNDVYFNDGKKTPMTAEDVKFTLDMAMKERVKSALAGFVKCTVKDKYQVEIEIETYNNEFIQSLSSVPLSIQSKKAYEDSSIKEPWFIGTGPYKYDKWVQGEYCRLNKVKDYWGNNLPATDIFAQGVSDVIEFRPMIEASARVMALQAGEIDVCVNPPISDLKFLQDDKNITVLEQTGTRLFYFAFNVTQKPWDNKKLRQAVACAIDKKSVLDAALNGKGTLQKTILNRGLWGFYDEMPGYDFNLDRAKKLMAEAGVTGPIECTLTHATGAPYEQIATVIQANLAKIGINVKLVPMEQAALKSACKDGKQGLYLWRWNEDSKVDFVYRDLFYSGSGSNYQHFADKKADKMIDDVATLKDQKKRLETGIELQKYLVEECPQVPLYIANLVIAYNKNLKGQYFYGGGNHNWSHAYIAK